MKGIRTCCDDGKKDKKKSTSQTYAQREEILTLMQLLNINTGVTKIAKNGNSLSLKNGGE